MKVLVIGTGSIASRHMQNLRSVSGVEMIAVMSSRERELNPRDFGADLNFVSFEAALEWAPDRVIVASPAPFHLLHARRFAEAGIALLLEKPLSHDWESCEENLEWLLKHEDRISIGYNLRYLQSAGHIKSLLNSEWAGEILSVGVDVGQYLPEWRPGHDYRLQVSARKELGGGVILELSHELDLIVWLLGEPRGVYCQCRRTGTLSIDVEDTVDAVVNFKSSVIVNLHMDFLQRVKSRVMKFVTTSGNIEWNLATDSIEFATKQGRRALYSPPHLDSNYSYFFEMQQFISFGVGPTRVDEALDVMRLVSGMRRSSMLGEYVALGDARD